LRLDITTLTALRRQHPAWKLLLSDHAPLVASFLHRVFVAPNVRYMSAANLSAALEDELFALREQQGEAAYPRSARDYLNDWAENERGWLRKFYPEASDEAHFELTPATESVIAWLSSLTGKAFVGTESRLLTLFELLRQMSLGSETNPSVRVKELYKRRDEIDADIARTLRGSIDTLDDTAIKERFQQFSTIARELLADFREVEHNFRQLDRHVRERIALWDGAKGELLQEIMGQRDSIADSDQGRSFRAFYDFLMSQARQEEFTQLLDQVLTLPPVAELKPDSRTRRVHYDWLEAGEHTQGTVALLSKQLRRFLDDRAYLENRRIMDILHNIESQALQLRSTPPQGNFTSIIEIAASVELPMERPLHSPAHKPIIADIELEPGDQDVDAGVLFTQIVIDKARLRSQLHHALQERSRITLRELLDLHPLTQGLAELIAYLEIAAETAKSTTDEQVTEQVYWQTTSGRLRQASLPRVIFLR
jgi:hypothetical protein